MKDYVCFYGLYHDRPCNRDYTGKVLPRSNNGWIYSAYANRLKLPLDRQLIFKTYNMCVETPSQYEKLNRLPGKQEPPMSRDEIIGMISLGYLHWKWLDQFDWQFYGYSSTKYPLLTQIKAVLSLRGEHRNHVWENRILEAYPIAFKLFWHDRYYVKEYSGQATSLFETFMFQLYVISTLTQDNISAKNILWLQLKDLKSKFWIRFVKQEENFMEYFGQLHPFNTIKKDS